MVILVCLSLRGAVIAHEPQSARPSRDAALQKVTAGKLKHSRAGIAVGVMPASPASAGAFGAGGIVTTDLGALDIPKALLAIQSLRLALDPRLWRDPTHLQPPTGVGVFIGARTTRWTGAAGACFVSNFGEGGVCQQYPERPHSRGFADLIYARFR